MFNVVIDPGHAPGNVNKGANGYYEFSGMWKLSLFLKTALERSGFKVLLTRNENEDPLLSVRGKKGANADLFISEHSNAGGGIGVEAYHSVNRLSDKALANNMSKAISGTMKTKDRGAKTRESERYKGKDYYTVMESAISSGAKHVLLVENGFHDNLQDEAFLLKNENLKAIAETQAKVICDFFKVAYVYNSSTFGTPFAKDEIELLEKIVWCEARGEDLKGQMLVVNVILNRLKNKQFPNTIKDVIFQPMQFQPTRDGSFYKATPTQLNIEAVKKALCVDYSQGALYFRAIKGATPDCWHEKALTKLFDHGAHRFYK